MNIFVEFKALKEKVSGFLADQTKATATSLADISSRLTAIESGAIAGLESAQASIKDLTSDLSAATGQISDINLALKAAASALKLDLKAEATPLETVAALQAAVTTTLAKLSVPVNVIPAPKPADTNKPGAKSMSMEDFRKLSPAQRMAFSKEVAVGVATLTE